MPTSEVRAGAPCYVLMDGNRRIGPDVVPSSAGSQCTAIYGFSDKAPYDAFCQSSPLALKPYPLVQGYLRSQLETAGEAVQLVVIDAVGPAELVLHAATMSAVLQAQENRAAHVSVTHELVLQADGYRVEDVS